MAKNEGWAAIESLLREMIEGQHAHLLKCAKRIVPEVTTS